MILWRVYLLHILFTLCLVSLLPFSETKSDQVFTAQVNDLVDRLHHLASLKNEQEDFQQQQQQQQQHEEEVDEDENLQSLQKQALLGPTKTRSKKRAPSKKRASAKKKTSSKKPKGASKTRSKKRAPSKKLAVSKSRSRKRAPSKNLGPSTCYGCPYHYNRKIAPKFSVRPNRRI